MSANKHLFLEGGCCVVVIDREEQLKIVKEVHEYLSTSEKAVVLVKNLWLLVIGDLI